jgi:hypothetical protein
MLSDPLKLGVDYKPRRFMILVGGVPRNQDRKLYFLTLLLTKCTIVLSGILFLTLDFPYLQSLRVTSVLLLRYH